MEISLSTCSYLVKNFIHIKTWQMLCILGEISLVVINYFVTFAKKNKPKTIDCMRQRILKRSISMIAVLLLNTVITSANNSRRISEDTMEDFSNIDTAFCSFG